MKRPGVKHFQSMRWQGKRIERRKVNEKYWQYVCPESKYKYFHDGEETKVSLP